MDLRKIKKLIDLLEESNLAELEIKEGEESVRLSRVRQGMPDAQATPRCAIAMPIAAPRRRRRRRPPRPKPPAAHADKELPEGHIVRVADGRHVLRARPPGSPAFVKVGQSVKAGDTLGIIEAMKMFNQIEADIAGTIVAVLVENGSRSSSTNRCL